VRARGGGAKGDIPVIGLRLHLNGGPRDDEVVSMSGYNHTLEIPGIIDPLPLASTALPTLSTKVGSYAPRRDDFGQLVPHNLEGVVEADWQGWRE
jgi:hypothetical protein